jgi:hypothetical protein
MTHFALPSMSIIFLCTRVILVLNTCIRYDVDGWRYVTNISIFDMEGILKEINHQIFGKS